MQQTVTSLHETPWQAWLSCSETQLFHIHEPAPGLFIAESPNVIERAMNAGYAPVSFLIDPKFRTEQVDALLTRAGDIPVYYAESSVLNTIPGMHLTRGVLCAMQRKQAAFSPADIAGKTRIVLLENVMNPTNLGAIFRSAAALGMEYILLTGGCTDPLYRRAARVAMGTVFQIPWGFLPQQTAAEAIAELRTQGFVTAAAALKPDALTPDDRRLKTAQRLCIVLGTEGEGLCAETVSACDYTVCIPMMNGVDSLNVAAASAVIFYTVANH